MNNFSVCIKAHPAIWSSPSGWTGPDPVLYYSFDCPDNLTFMEGTNETNNQFEFISGQVILYSGAEMLWAARRSIG